MKISNDTRRNNDVPSCVAVLERNLVNLPVFEDIKDVEQRLGQLPGTEQDCLSMRLAMYVTLVDLYTTAACFDAALIAMRRAEFIFLELVEDSEGWVTREQVSFFIDRYCKLNLFDEAQRMAEETMVVLRQRDDYERSDERYLLEHWLYNIDQLRYLHEQRLEAMNNSPDLPIANAKVERGDLENALLYFAELSKQTT